VNRFGQPLERIRGAAAGAGSALGRIVRERPGRAIAGLLFGAALLAVVAAGVFWAMVYLTLPRIPTAPELWTYNREAGVTFMDASGEIVGVRGPSYGRHVSLAQLPAHVPQAFIAIEDRRFYEHRGVDNTAIIRAAWANVTAGRTVQGGSTISQQLAKNLFLTRDQTMRRKLQEVIIASRLERIMSKDELLELYLNRVYLGEQAYGVDAAARRFFGKPATELTLGEAAMLAGLPKAPSRTAPTTNFTRAKERQVVVLEAMLQAGFITREQHDAAIAEPINIQPADQPEGRMGYVFDMAVEQVETLLPDGPPGDLVIQLTIDQTLQGLAEEAVRQNIRMAAEGRPQLQAAMVVVDRTGAVRALFGGMSYEASKFNRAFQARRQPGSSFKAFVYAAALERGFHPEDVRYDEPITIQGWRPSNYDDGYRGAVTLRNAFALSLNTVAAEIGHETGLTNIVGLARRFGVTLGPDPAAFDDRHIPLSITLGSVETSVWDLTQGFSVFMNGGSRADAHLIASLQDSRGVVLYQRPEPQYQQVYAEHLNEDMTSLMGAVVQRGTATSAQIAGRDVAGKSGTSQNWQDAWFIGYSAHYTAGVWVGLDDNTSMTRVAGRVTGGGLPASIWRDFMAPAIRDLPDEPLPGIAQPRRSERERSRGTFYQAVRDALSLPFRPERNWAAPAPPAYTD
jgi:penicillin-binding protein 1A